MLLAKTENFLRRQGKPLVAFISRLGEFSVLSPRRFTTA